MGSASAYQLYVCIIIQDAPTTEIISAPHVFRPLRISMMGSRGDTKNNSCAFSTLFKFLPEFMTRLIQWGLKPSKNSNYLENHAFRGQIAVPRLTSFMYV